MIQQYEPTRNRPRNYQTPLLMIALGAVVATGFMPTWIGVAVCGVVAVVAYVAGITADG